MRLRNIPGAKEAIKSSDWVIQNPENHKGSWNQLFPNPGPLHIEIGMGKGRFLMDMAAAHPDINYIGIERYDSVLLRALQKIEERRQKGEIFNNVHFLCADAAEITSFFGPGEADRIYLNFSDPWPKSRHAHRRLTSGEFLKRYEEILADEGRIEFKTDNLDLFEFSLESVREQNWRLCAMTYDLHKDHDLSEGNIMTEYEEKFSSLGNPICKMIIKKPETTKH